MCNKKDCKKIWKMANYLPFLEVEKQLEKCEMCAYRKKVDKVKQKTYDTVRLAFVERYWRRTA